MAFGARLCVSSLGGSFDCCFLKSRFVYWYRLISLLMLDCSWHLWAGSYGVFILLLLLAGSGSFDNSQWDGCLSMTCSIYCMLLSYLAFGSVLVCGTFILASFVFLSLLPSSGGMRYPSLLFSSTRFFSDLLKCLSIVVSGGNPST